MKKTSCLLALLLPLPSLLCGAQSTPATANSTSNTSARAAGSRVDPNDTSAMSDPRKVVRMYRWDIPFAMLAAKFTQADIPAFVSVLNDDNRPADEQSGDYSVALGLIWRLSSRNNDQVAADLLEAFKKPIQFQQFTNHLPDLRDVLMYRRNILEAIGRVGGTKAETILKQALTKEGARELSRAWFFQVPAEVFPPDNLLALIRGEAAMGLVYINSPEALDLVRGEYTRERQACITADKSSRYYNYLASAMAQADALKAMGYDKSKPAPSGRADLDRSMEFIGNYTLKLNAWESDPIVR
jgi:hypothetical protein